MKNIFIILALLSFSVLMLYGTNFAFSIGRLQVAAAPSLSNVTDTPNPALNPVNWYYALSLAIPIAYILRELLGYWKDHHWKRKYKDVIVTKPL